MIPRPHAHIYEFSMKQYISIVAISVTGDKPFGQPLTILYTGTCIYIYRNIYIYNYNLKYENLYRERQKYNHIILLLLLFLKIQH
jgi:hypothetical protein